MKFNFDDYKGKYAMRCETEEEAENFCQAMNAQGRKWNTGVSYTDETYWNTYEEDTIYCFNEGIFADVKFAKREGYTVLKWSDFVYKKIKLYIAGKITGDADYKVKFAEAQKVCEKRGYTVLTPTCLPQGLQPADYMRICFAMIDTADAVVFLPDFMSSAGAKLEYEYCFYTDKRIISYESVNTN